MQEPLVGGSETTVSTTNARFIFQMECRAPTTSSSRPFSLVTVSESVWLRGCEHGRSHTTRTQDEDPASR